MTAFVIQIEFQVGGASNGLTTLTAAFERAGAELADLSRYLFPRLTALFESTIADQFDAEGQGPQAGSWAPLSSSYAAWKQAHYPGQPKLVLSGALRAGLTQSSSPNAMRSMDGDVFRFGTRGLDYASFHQTGTGKMPARPPIDLGGDFEKGLRVAALAAVRDAVREASRGVLDFEGSEYEGQEVMTGRNGGRYINTAGSRTYLKRAANGAVIKRTYRGKR